jgi:flagellar assembly protein FliH
MKWFESIPFNRPLHDVRVLTQSPLQDWSEHIAEREKAAYEKGLHEGESALNEQLVRQRNEIGILLNGLVDSLRNSVPQVVHEAESAMIQLALESAQKVVAGLPIPVETVEAVVREALREVEDTAEITIRVHPEDLALLQKHSAAILNGLPGAGPLRFLASAEVTRGGCLVQTRFGVIDARRETKFDQLHETIAA